MPGAKPSRWATTAEVAEAAGVTDSTVMKWAQRGVLPPYTTVHGGARGRAARWPLFAPEQARWVRGRLEEGLTFEEIRAMLAAGEFKSSSSED
ncbi:MAG: helix-turn-helix domain-containing protein [Dehalococcoidia bacterium]|nr:helix-turn-helix domain-containing protein [Dehalococcoidia bacterium]